MSELEAVTDGVLRRCRELGFARAGIAPAEATAYEAELRQWLAAGKHGEMGYLKRHEELLVDPRRVMPGARSIVCVADRYAVGEGAEAFGRKGRDGAKGNCEGEGPRGRIARYARGEDYHVVMKKRLHQLCDELGGRFPGEQFRACVDTAPLLEREYARRAGIGAIGKHTLLIEPGVGSYLLLGEVLTTLELAPSEPVERDICGRCRRCIEACPTEAIALWSVDASRCISYLTIEHRRAIDGDLFSGMGDRIFGCDVCQEVCPHNQPTLSKGEAAINPAYARRREGFDLLKVLDWREEDRRAAFVKSAMRRATLEMMKRNALIAAGNILAERDDAALEARIAAIARDKGEDPMVRETARSVLARRRVAGEEERAS